MKECSNCKSNNIISNVRIIDHGHGDYKRDLALETYKDPNAIFFKGTKRFPLKTEVCSNCGKVEFYIDNPQELMKHNDN